jgi:dephospho-CoA kinase
MKIIGITGTLSAGKGAIVDYLVYKRGFKHFSVSGYITKKLKEREIEVNRDTMLALGNELRTNHSGDYIVYELLHEAKEYGQDCIIESIRTTDELLLLKMHGIETLSVDADQRLRYDRSQERASEKDKVTFERFQLQEKIESEGIAGDKPNLIECRNLISHEFRLTNNGTLKELYLQVEDALILIK